MYFIIKPNGFLVFKNVDKAAFNRNLKLTKQKI